MIDFFSLIILDMILTQRSGQSAFKDLLESETIDIEKLKQNVQKNSIIAELKPLYWKILLGTIPLDISFASSSLFQVLNLPIEIHVNTLIKPIVIFINVSIRH